MSNVLRVFSGPARFLSLFDSTNGKLFLGLADENINVLENPFSIVIMNGNQLETKRLANFEIPLLQTDSTFLTNLKARLEKLQYVYILGDEMMIVFDNVYLAIQPSRSYKAGEAHKFVLKGQKAISADFHSLINLLGKYGNCNLDSNSDNVADGWTDTGCTNLLVTTSHLGAGYGNEQQFEMNTGDSMHCRVRVPFESGYKIKLTASAYIDNLKAGTSYYQFGIDLLNDSAVVVDSDINTGQSIASGQNTRISHSATIEASEDILFAQVIFKYDSGGTGHLGIDNVQLELGLDLTDYSED